MENVIKMIAGFFGGITTILMAVLPGGSVFGMDVIANLTALVDGFGQGGFTGLVVLLLVASFFIKK